VTGELDDRPDWERSVDHRDLAEIDYQFRDRSDMEAEAMREQRDLEGFKRAGYGATPIEAVRIRRLLVRHCVNCGLKKPLRSSGRCYACEKYHQRHPGEERPAALYRREIARKIERDGFL